MSIEEEYAREYLRLSDEKKQIDARLDEIKKYFRGLDAGDHQFGKYKVSHVVPRMFDEEAFTRDYDPDLNGEFYETRVVVDKKQVEKHLSGEEIEKYKVPGTSRISVKVVSGA